MDLLKALKSKGRTVQELVDLTGMSRGGVIQALRRNKKLIKKVGSKREHERGPESTLYQLKAGAVIKAKPKGRPAKRLNTATATVVPISEVPAEITAPLQAPVDANGSPVEDLPVPDVQTAVSPEAVNETLAAANEAAIEAGEKTPDEA